MVTDLYQNLALGFSLAVSLKNLLMCLFGVSIGTLIGVLPGIGPVSTIAMLLPLTFAFDPITSLIMLAGIYYGAQYGGSTSAILVNLPGETSSIVTCLDGHQMARQGKAGEALAIAALSSFIAGTASTLVIALFTPVLAKIAATFSSPEYFALMVLGICAVLILAAGSLLKAFGMLLIGFLFGMVGTDSTSGAMRFTLGISDLSDGIGFVPLSLGFFGFVELVSNLADPEAKKAQVIQAKFQLLPSKESWRRAWPAIGRGTIVGSILGVLPGGGAVLSSFSSYAIEKKFARHPEEFGKGAIQGVAGPEAANNAGAQTSFIPMFTLGIPANPVMALMLGALMIQGIAPGPTVMQKPELFWAVVASMWIGNVMLVILNLPLVGLWVKLLQVPYHSLFPAILIVSCLGIYSVNNNSADILQAAFFCAIGYTLVRMGCEATPLVLGFVLGGPMEEHLKRSLLISDGDLTVFFTRPVSAGVLILAMLVLCVAILPAVRSKRERVFVE
jgi:TctA family transporter